MQAIALVYSKLISTNLAQLVKNIIKLGTQKSEQNTN